MHTWNIDTKVEVGITMCCLFIENRAILTKGTFKLDLSSVLGPK